MKVSTRQSLCPFCCLRLWTLHVHLAAVHFGMRLALQSPPTSSPALLLTNRFPHLTLNSGLTDYCWYDAVYRRYLGQALAMLFVPYIATAFGPGTQFRVAGLLALAWLTMWWNIGSDHPPDTGGGGIGASGPAGSAVLIEEGSMEAVPPFNKKEDPTPLLQEPLGPKSGAVGGSGGAGGAGGRGGCKADGSGGIPWGVLVRSSAVWAIVTNNFAFHYATYVLMSWLPTYFQDHVGVALSDMSSRYKVSLLAIFCDAEKSTVLSAGSRGFGCCLD